MSVNSLDIDMLAKHENSGYTLDVSQQIIAGWGVAVNWEKKAFDEDSKNVKQLPRMFLFSFLSENLLMPQDKKSHFLI